MTEFFEVGVTAVGDVETRGDCGNEFAVYRYGDGTVIVATDGGTIRFTHDQWEAVKAAITTV